jgi:hypothetical protein
MGTQETSLHLNPALIQEQCTFEQVESAISINRVTLMGLGAGEEGGEWIPKGVTILL